MQHKTDLNREQLTINSWPEKFPTHCIHGWNMVRLYIAVINGTNLCWLPPWIIPERIDTLLESSQSMKGRAPSRKFLLYSVGYSDTMVDSWKYRISSNKLLTCNDFVAVEA